MKKLSGREAWRIRIADYRIIYEIEDARHTILVVVIGHRSSVYR
ncbi:MAG: type II toxin-antitoxin system RelE family toxin [Candidatus Brocadiia bacterium]